MCLNSHFIYNKYVNRSFLVPCGTCEACQQSKANFRTLRIRNHSNVQDFDCFFLTLTYTNDCMPYVLRKDLDERKSVVTVYRDSVCRVSHDTGIVSKVPGTVVLGTVEPDFTAATLDGQYPVMHNGTPDKVAVPFYKDMQDFIKRLRINLFRYYSYEYELSFFCCTEIGPSTFRPHAHLLVWVRKGCEEALRSAFYESWAYCDKSRLKRGFEQARNPSSYVSSYVNRSSDFPSIYKIRCFSPKHCYSKGFGFNVPVFQLDQVLAKIREGSLCYVSSAIKHGVPALVTFVYPRYVINKYFPKFKGFSRLADVEISDIILSPKRIVLYARRLRLSLTEIHRIKVMLTNAVKYFCECTGLGVYDYAWYYVRSWTVYALTGLKLGLTSVLSTDEWYEYYDNGSVLIESDRIFEFFSDTCRFVRSSFVVNPNERSWVLESHNVLVDIFYRKLKQRKVANLCMSNLKFLV